MKKKFNDFSSKVWQWMRKHPIATFFIAILIFVATNYTSQQIDNMIFNPSDSTISVRLKSIAGTTTLNVATYPVPDTATHFQSDTVAVQDTILVANFCNTRIMFSASATPADTFQVIIKSWRTDSVTVYPGGHFSSNYLDPFRKDTIFIKNKKVLGTTLYQFVSEGR
jgi:hypothetical protein